jgi:hypothetical protein
MTRLTFCLALPLLLVTTAATPARAHEVDQETPVAPLIATQPDPIETWYGWQTLLADGAGIAALAGCATLLENKAGQPFCVAPFLLAGPAVHLAHDRPARAVISFALNAALPITGALIGAATADCGKDQFLCGLSETGLGLMVGLVAAMTIDAVISFDSEAAPPRPVARRAPTLLPTVALTSGGAGLGLAGRF